MPQLRSRRSGPRYHPPAFVARRRAPLVFIDRWLSLFIALQREAWQSLIAGTIAGLTVDAASGESSARRVSKTLTAYVVYWRRRGLTWKIRC
jgi:hypothetical protein